MLKIRYQGKNIPVYECFEYLSGNSGLTVRTIHNSKGKMDDCTVLSSSILDSTSLGYIYSKTILPSGKMLKLFENKEGIVISRNGYAGTMSYISPGLYTLTDHAYILHVKNECKYKIDLKWFILSFQKEIQDKYLTTKKGNQTFTITRFMKDFKFDIPTIEIQREITEKYELIEKAKKALILQKEKINSFVLEEISGYEVKNIPLFKLFEPHQGNAIYTKKNINNNGWKGNIPVISSNTSNAGILDYIDEKFILPNDLVKVKCLTWSVDGNAGKLFARNLEENPSGFVANNHCGVLFPVVDTKNIYFPYLVYFLQSQFFGKAKNTSNKKLGNNQMKDIIVSIPVNECGEFNLHAQIEIVKKVEIIENIKKQAINKIDELISSSIVFD